MPSPEKVWRVVTVNDKSMGTLGGGLRRIFTPILIISAFFVIKVIVQRAFKIKSILT